MATSVKQAFNEYAKNLNITDKQEKIVSNCRTNVVKKISQELSLHTEQTSKLIGSYDRDTMIRYLNEGDVDILVVLHYGENSGWDNKEGVTKALNKFKSILSSTYPDTQCNIDRNCVTMKLSQFRFDVVPAFRYKQGYYTIPDTYRGDWLKTDPISFSHEITRINKNMDGCFIPLVKMIKGWNREFTKTLRSFHLECMMINHYKSYTQSYTYNSMIKVFFSNLASYLNSPSYDPITGDRVDLYIDNGSLGNSRNQFVARAQKAFKQADEAFSDSETYPSVAIDEWKNLLGTFFPAYG